MNNKLNHKTKPRGSHRWLQRGVRPRHSDVMLSSSERRRLAFQRLASIHRETFSTLQDLTQCLTQCCKYILQYQKSNLAKSREPRRTLDNKNKSDRKRGADHLEKIKSNQSQIRQNDL